MALKKVFTTTYGVSVEYWKIANIVEDFIANKIHIVLGGYINQEARLNGSDSLNRKDVTLEGDAYSSDMDRKSLYEEIKELEEWSDAEDC